ncbi:hypothetical protein ACTA71_005551 [Dictyostelium dimigraforme]
MNKFVLLLISIILMTTFVKCDDFDPSKKAEFSFFCDTDCDKNKESSPSVVTLDVGSCQSYSDHCKKQNVTSINIFTSYNITTQLYTFNASSPSNAQCTGGVSGYPDQTVSCDQCFTFMGGNRATLRCSDSSTLLSSSFFVFSIALVVLLF